jgi:hypothetical protein
MKQTDVCNSSSSLQVHSITGVVTTTAGYCAIIVIIEYKDIDWGHLAQNGG